jgi:hypothetical protein
VLARNDESRPGASTTRALEVGVTCAAMVTAKVTMLPLAALLAAFDEQALQAYEGTRAQFAGGLTLRFEAAYWSPPLVLLAGAGLVLRHPVRSRRLLWTIAGVQALLLALVLPPELRHLGRRVYRNDSASFYPSRTPRRELGGRSHVDVFELLPSGSSAGAGRVVSTEAGCEQDPH